MSSLPPSTMTVQLFSEVLLLDQFTRNRMVKALPEGVELSQFLVMLHLAASGEEIGPAKLASAFHVTRGAMSNTLGRLEKAGQIVVRGDTIDARRKFISLSEKGQATLDAVLEAIKPVFEDTLSNHHRNDVDRSVVILSDLREAMSRHRA